MAALGIPAPIYGFPPNSGSEGFPFDRSEAYGFNFLVYKFMGLGALCDINQAYGPSDDHVHHLNHLAHFTSEIQWIGGCLVEIQF
jgi:hypothetical protein